MPTLRASMTSRLKHHIMESKMLQKLDQDLDPPSNQADEDQENGHRYGEIRKKGAGALNTIRSIKRTNALEQASDELPSCSTFVHYTEPSS